MAQEYFLGPNSVSYQTTKNVELKDLLTLVTDEGPIDLDIKIIADFDSIPPKYHEVFINMMTSKYYNKASFGHNPFSECSPPKVKKWWQFWKQDIYNKQK